MNMVSRKVVLIIMDGWGWREERDGNAVQLAETPNVDRLWRQYPHTLINASGPHVGLPEGQMGNSEVGHLNLGAGRVVFQDFVRIDNAIADGSFFDNEALARMMDDVASTGNALHILGLLSDGGVHSHERHLHALIRMAADRNVSKLYIHAILDGRDTPPHNGIHYLRRLEDRMQAAGVGKVASVVGRHNAMDRDQRWERTQRAYDLFTAGRGESARDPFAAIEASYAAGVTDEFVEPIVVARANGEPLATIADGDAVMFFNFRADRARQITKAIMDDQFDGFPRQRRVHVQMTCMTRYHESFPFPVVFPPDTRRNILADVTARKKRSTLRIAESEKYAHVTYFFNGGNEEAYDGETRILIPSPKVPTYDLAPEMSAFEIADRLVREIVSNRHDYIVCNFANPDMVGHTGVLEAAIKACETVDTCVGRVIDAMDLESTVAIVIADHGNADEMIDYVNGGPHTAHTTNLVPCILVDSHYDGELIEGGALRDIAPTILNYLGIDISDEMTGRDLRVTRVS